MFHKHNSFTNTLSPSDQISSYLPESFGTKEATNNFFVAPQPKAIFSRSSTAPVTQTLSAGPKPVAGLLTEKIAAAVASTAAKAHTTAAAATTGHGHGHGHGHAEPWEGVNLWRTPYKGDTDTITQVKRTKGALDQYVENRTRRIQEMQLFALRNKSTPTWIMMPRDKIVLGVQVLLAGYVIFQVTTKVYDHLKAKDRLKLLKLLYKDNTN